jgi:DNA-binding NarL/FixJ family response regulator
MDMKTRSTAARVESLRLLVVDDHELARAGLVSILESEPGFEVVGTAGSGRKAMQLARKLKPDVVLMDIRMPDIDGLRATRAIKKTCPATAVVMVTIVENPDYLLEAVRAGASGYLLKDAAKQEIVTAVRHVAHGDSSLPGDVALRLVQRLASEDTPAPKLLPESMTPRERDVLRLMVRGLTNPEIARSLSLQVSTVKTHVEHIIAKLNASDRTQAAVRAMEMGLLNDTIDDGQRVTLPSDE